MQSYKYKEMQKEKEKRKEKRKYMRRLRRVHKPITAGLLSFFFKHLKFSKTTFKNYLFSNKAKFKTKIKPKIKSKITIKSKAKIKSKTKIKSKIKSFSWFIVADFLNKLNLPDLQRDKLLEKNDKKKLKLKEIAKIKKKLFKLKQKEKQTTY